MSLVAVGGKQRIANTDGAVTKTIEFALAEFGSVLTDDERKELQQIKQVPDASAVLNFTAKLDTSDSARRGRSIGARVYSMLQSIQQFTMIVDTFVSSHPEIAALVWGSVKLTLLIAANITSYFKSLADLFMSLNKLFPQYEEYKLLFPRSSKLQEAICAFHASIVQMCKQSILLTRQSWIRNVTADLSSRLGPQIENTRNCAKDVKQAIALAKATYDRQEQESQEQERKLANTYRKHMSIFTKQSQTELENSRDWQRRRDKDLLMRKRMKLLDSLSTYEHQKNFVQALRKRHAKTAVWLLSSIEFEKWKHDKMGSVFFLTGKIGSGKTVLTSAVIEHLCCVQNQTDELTTFILSRFDDSASLIASSVLRSIIRQCLKPNNMTKETERQLSELKTNNEDLESIKILLQHCTSRFSTLYIVIDSLDEFEKEERSLLLRLLSSIISRSDSRTKLFLVGRVSISSDVRTYFPGVCQMSTNCGEVRVDIEAYIRENIALRQREDLPTEERLVLGDPTLAQEITKVLINGANGMFLWVDFQIVEICECTRDEHIRKALKSLPKSLGETFDRAMKRILKRGSAETAMEIFRWVAASKRTLSLDELREALSYEPGTPYSIRGRIPNSLERIPLWCENLVQVDEEFQTVQFTHHSVLQHLLKPSSDLSLQRFYINLEEADHFIGEICVTYLNSNEFKTEMIRKPAVLPTTLPNYIINETVEKNNIAKRIVRATQKLNTHIRSDSNSNEGMVTIKADYEDLVTTLKLGHPFLEYARRFWLPHTHAFELAKSITWSPWKQMIRSSQGLIETPWAPEEFSMPSNTIYQWLEENDHFAVFHQLVSTAELTVGGRIRLLCHYARLGRLNYLGILVGLVQDKHELSYGLAYAAGWGQLEAVQKLLDAKADTNTTVDFGELKYTVLQAAHKRGYLELTQKLLDAEAKVDAAACRSRGFTALQAAARGGHLEIVQRLLDVNADVNAAASPHEGGLTALHFAAGGGCLEIVRRLLDAKANVNAVTNFGSTALQFAAAGGYLEIVQRLLDAKADVNIVDEFGATALQDAAECGYLEIVQRLLDAKANVNAFAKFGSTALQFAAKGGYLEIVQRLLDAKADVNIVDELGSTALLSAAKGGYLEIVQRLLDAKADVNTASSRNGGWTALQAATEGGHQEVIILLESFGASS